MGHGSVMLLDYRRQVAAHYAEARRGPGSPEERWQRWRRRRDELFGGHFASALTEADRSGFAGLQYYNYDPTLRFEVKMEAVAVQTKLQVDLAQDGRLLLQPLGRLHFSIDGESTELTAFWLTGYGGGLFLPFRDGTNGKGTYGGGRYLLDTIKGADLGSVDGQLVLDFNYAYNPSCAYNPQWHCPLAPTENWLKVPIEAGEKQFKDISELTPDPSAVPSST